jgi:starvation-inducible DNA-binding protein
MYSTRNDLAETTRTKVIELLDARLADATDLQTELKQAHWNVKGPTFIALHELFDKINEAVEDYVDDLAERVVQLGGIAYGTARQVAKRSTLPECPAVSAGRDHTEAVATALAAFGRLARAGIISRTRWRTGTPRTSSPRFRAGSTSGCGSSRRISRRTDNPDGTETAAGTRLARSELTC